MHMGWLAGYLWWVVLSGHQHNAMQTDTAPTRPSRGSLQGYAELLAFNTLVMILTICSLTRCTMSASSY